MSLKNVEKKLQEITGNFNLRLRKDEYFHKVYGILDYLIYTIARINKEEKDIIAFKEYDSDIMESRKDRAELYINCDSIFALLRKRKLELLTQFNEIIEELCKNQEFFLIFDDLLPNMELVIEYIETQHDIEDILDWLETSLTQTDLDELDDYDVFEFIDEEFKAYFDYYYEDVEEGVSNEGTGSN